MRAMYVGKERRVLLHAPLAQNEKGRRGLLTTVSTTTKITIMILLTHYDIHVIHT